jgi:hypothetical protein
MSLRVRGFGVYATMTLIVAMALQAFLEIYQRTSLECLTIGSSKSALVKYEEDFSRRSRDRNVDPLNRSDDPHFLLEAAVDEEREVLRDL